jgi:hypothetical protein
MRISDERPPAVAEEQATDDAPVTAHRCSADRIVFTEQDNTDGWIATYLTVEVSR